MNALVLTFAALTGVLGNIPWLYHRGPRFTAWMEAASAFLLVAGYPPWAAVLAAYTVTTTGLGWLAVVFLIAALCMYYEAWYRYKEPKPNKQGVMPKRKPRRDHYDAVRTMAIAFVFGTSLFMVIALRVQVLKLLAKLPPATLKAIHHSTTSVQSGHASKAIAHGQASQLLIVAIIAFIALVIVRMRIKGKRIMPRRQRKNSTPGRPAPSPVSTTRGH
jgi:hypothetical protein